MAHNVGTGGQQSPADVVFAFKTIGGRFSAGAVLEIGTGRHVAEFQYERPVCTLPGGWHTGDLDRHLIVRTGKTDDLRPVFPPGIVRLSRIGCGSVIERIVAGDHLSCKVIPGGEPHLVEPATVQIVDFRMMRIS